MIKILATVLLLVCISFQSAAASPMNKKDLIAHVAEAANLSLADAATLVDAVLDGITEALSRGEEVRLVRFGTFWVAHRSARQGRNPRTGKPVNIPASNQPKFRAGKGLKAAVNKPESSSQGGTGEKSPLPEQSAAARPMNKNDLIAHVAEAANLSLSDAAAVVDAVLDGITEALSRGEVVRLVGFGSFWVVHRRATKGRNPRTGKPINIPARNHPKFRAGKGLKAAVNPRRESELDSSTTEQATTASPTVTVPDVSVKPTLREGVMATGTVKWFNPAKGYGFITPDDGGKDVFVHITAVERAGMRTLSEGQKVKFKVVEDPRGLKASELAPAEE